MTAIALHDQLTPECQTLLDIPGEGITVTSLRKICSDVNDIIDNRHYPNRDYLLYLLLYNLYIHSVERSQILLHAHIGTSGPAYLKLSVIRLIFRLPITLQSRVRITITILGHTNGQRH